MLDIRHELPGWALYWAFLTPVAVSDPARLDALVARERERLLGSAWVPEAEPVVSIRRLFREAGTDPTRHRPSSEALARRIRRGDPFPRVHPLVDLNNLLSLRTRLPCSVVRRAAVGPSIVLRRGAADEWMESLRGPMAVDGKPLLADVGGPFGSPISDARRVALAGTAEDVVLLVYAPRGIDGEPVSAALGELIQASQLGTVTLAAWTR